MQTATQDPLAMLDELAAKPAKRSATSAPMVERPDMAGAIMGWLDNKAKVDHYNSLKETFEQQIVTAAAEERMMASRRNGDVVSTVKLAAEGRSVSVTYQCRYCKVPDDAVAELRERLGESFDRYFASQTCLARRPPFRPDPDG
jgi:hypothetical protein